MSLREEFLQKELRLSEICALLAAALEKTTVRNGMATRSILLRLSKVFDSSMALKERNEAASALRAMFHKEGFIDNPPNGTSQEQWAKTAEEALFLSMIYSEARFAAVRELPVK